MENKKRLLLATTASLVEQWGRVCGLVLADYRAQNLTFSTVTEYALTSAITNTRALIMDNETETGEGRRFVVWMGNALEYIERAAEIVRKKNGGGFIKLQNCIEGMLTGLRSFLLSLCGAV